MNSEGRGVLMLDGIDKLQWGEMGVGEGCFLFE